MVVSYDMSSVGVTGQMERPPLGRTYMAAVPSVRSNPKKSPATDPMKVKYLMWFFLGPSLCSISWPRGMGENMVIS